MLSGKRFCDSTEIEDYLNGKDIGAALGLGGAYNDFTRWYERLTLSLRGAGMSRSGFGWTATIPRAIPFPFIGGWTTVKLNGRWPDGEAPISIDVMYMTSASRFLEPYVGLGREGDGWFKGEHDLALEAGMRFRFPALGTLLGARIGVRANGAKSLHGARRVAEFGGGVW